MQPSPAWKSNYEFSPLEMTDAPLDASHEDLEASADASTASNPNIAMLVERLKEPLRQTPGQASRPAKPDAASGHGPVPLQRDNEAAQAPARLAAPAPAPKNSGLPANGLVSRLPIAGLVSGFIGIALVPLSFLFFLWWQETGQPPQQDVAAVEMGVTSVPAAAGLAQPEQSASSLDASLTAPGRIEGQAGETIAFPLAIDAAAALPARSIVAVSGLPQGTSFSQGRPYGDTGWSLSTDETAGLHVRLPSHNTTTDIRLELIAGDGTVLAQSETQLSIAPPPVATVDDPADDAVASVPMGEAAPADETVVAAGGALSQESASAEMTGSIAPAEASSAPPGAPDVTVTTVKTVTVDPPREVVPHDGAMALGSPADEPQGTGEWMVTKTAVDMHARAEQRSETVKIAQGGIKVRVTGRDRNWIQVHDPASGTTGWIYNRFLTPTEPPAE